MEKTLQLTVPRLLTVPVLAGWTKKLFGHYAILKLLSLRSPRSHQKISGWQLSRKSGKSQKSQRQEKSQWIWDKKRKVRKKSGKSQENFYRLSERKSFNILRFNPMILVSAKMAFQGVREMSGKMKVGKSSHPEQTITLKTVDHERSDSYVVFTMILCDLNFCIWWVIKLIFTV